MIELQDHRDRLERAFENLLKHDLQKHNRKPVKIVLASEQSITCCGDFWGMAAPGMGGWFGHPGRPCMLVNDAAILHDCGCDVEAATQVMTAVAVHELGHFLTEPRLCDDAISNAPSSESVKQFLTTPSQVDAAEHVRETPQHGSDFIRVALHARHRMQAMGWAVPLQDLMDWSRFTHAPADWHLDALKTDFGEHVDKPLTTIWDTPEPTKFRRLFDESLRSLDGLMTFLKGESR